MNNNTILRLLLCAGVLLAPVSAFAVSIEWSFVGKPGNLADAADGDSDTPGIQHVGAVPYAFNIGKYDVTNSQYAEFLNAKDPTGANALGLYNVSMASINSYGGIRHDSNGYNAIDGRGNWPVNYVSWYDAARFTNWLNNGQGNGDTETGAYTLGALGPGGVPIDGLSITRNAGASVFLPSESEWYKAAYYDANTSSYFQYPTSSNTAPHTAQPPGLLNSANQGFNGNGQPTDVGAYTSSPSPSGTFDQGGNVFQWNDDVFAGEYRGLRGGSFGHEVQFLHSSTRSGSSPDMWGYDIGFRVAMVPEPSTLALAVLGLITLAAYRWRRRP